MAHSSSADLFKLAARPTIRNVTNSVSKSIGTSAKFFRPTGLPAPSPVRAPVGRDLFAISRSGAGDFRDLSVSPSGGGCVTACNLIPFETARNICLAGCGFISDSPPPGGSGLEPGTGPTGGFCVPPFFRNPATGRCEFDPIPGPGGGGTGPRRDSVGNGRPAVPIDPVAGSFGIPAARPALETRTVRRCPPKMILGTDELCYPKAVLPPRSKFRKNRRPIKPPLTRRDAVAIRRAGGARDRLAELAKDAGLHVSKSAPRRRKQTAADAHHAK